MHGAGQIYIRILSTIGIYVQLGFGIINSLNSEASTIECLYDIPWMKCHNVFLPKLKGRLPEFLSISIQSFTIFLCEKELCEA